MIVAARGLSVSVGGRRVLDAVDMAVAAGEIVAVAGPNGAGKSTLLRALAGVGGYGGRGGTTRSGEVLIDGAPAAALDRRARARAVAYLPQDRIVHWPLPVADLVALGRLPHGAAGALTAADRTKVEAAMRATDVAHLATRPVTELSGGERARVLLARALAQDARVLVADEPTAGLDLAHALQLFAHLSTLAADGRAVVVALHDLGLAVRFCHSLVLMAGGRVAAHGRPADVLTPAVFADVYGIRATLREVDGIPVVVTAQPLT